MEKKKVHFCSQVDVYQPVFVGKKQVYLLNKQLLRDDDTNLPPVKLSTVSYKVSTTFASAPFSLRDNPYPPSYGLLQESQSK